VAYTRLPLVNLLLHLPSWPAALPVPPDLATVRLGSEGRVLCVRVPAAIAHAALLHRFICCQFTCAPCHAAAREGM